MPYELFSNFHIRSGKLLLEPHTGSKKTSYREILDPPPLTNRNPFIGVLSDMEDARVNIFNIKESNATKCYIRGLSTCLTKEFENLHLTTKPLRQAVYSRLKLGVVREIYPTWREQVHWISEDTEEDPKLDEMLDNPETAVKDIFGHQKKPDGPVSTYRDLCWKNHRFAQKLVIAELCAWARGLDVSIVMESLP